MLDDVAVITKDSLSLPQSLLAQAKQHQRIDHCDDDALIASLIEAVIDRFESLNAVAIFEQSYEWAPAQFSDRAQIPYPPVTSFTANAGEFRIVTKGLSGISRQWLVGTWQDGLSLTLNAGYSPQSLPAGLRVAFARAAGHLYEYREILIGRDVQLIETWIDNTVAGYWQPHA